MPDKATTLNQLATQLGVDPKELENSTMSRTQTVLTVAWAQGSQDTYAIDDDIDKLLKELGIDINEE